MKNKIIISVVIFALMGGVSVYAAEPYPPELIQIKNEMSNTLSKKELSNCKASLVPVLDLEMMEFLKFLETHFENKSSTSSLANIALARYKQLKDDLMSHFYKLSVSPEIRLGNISQNIEIQSYDKCLEIVETYVTLGKEHMIRHIKNSGANKKTALLIEKYKSIDDKLKEMNNGVSKMYGYFMTFNNKLPGFLKQCVQK